jgi:hypothetical protein
VLSKKKKSILHILLETKNGSKFDYYELLAYYVGDDLIFNNFSY